MTKKREEATDVLRRQASQLEAKIAMIGGYGFWQFLRVVPKKADAIKASERLIGLSNSIGPSCDTEENHNRRKEIEELLRIKTGS